MPTDAALPIEPLEARHRRQSVVELALAAATALAAIPALAIVAFTY